MTLQEYETQIIDSDPTDWTVIPCWGAGSGPLHLERSVTMTSGTGEYSDVEVESHSMRASLKSDLSIWIAWGFQANPEFVEPWVENFTNPMAGSAYVDFFCNSALVYRDMYVSVDGGLCNLPMPDREFDAEGSKVFQYSVPRVKSEFFKILNSFESASDYDQFLERACIKLIDVAPWMI